MRRVVSLALLACAPGAALCCAAVTAAAAPKTNAKATAKAKLVTIHANSKLLRAANVDNPPAGQSAGDVIVFTERLSNAAGHTIGSDAATCTYLFDQHLLCTGVYALRGGQLFVSLLQPGLTGPQNYGQAITGGTGRYDGASGTVAVHQRPAGDQFVFHIRLPAS
jgi:hypothetical protein